MWSNTWHTIVPVGVSLVGQNGLFVELVLKTYAFSRQSTSLKRNRLTLDQQWLPNQSDFHQFHDLDTDFDLHRITSGFHRAFATSVACQQGMLTLPDTRFRPPFWDLLRLQFLRPNSSNLPRLYSIFHLEYPLVLSRFCPIIRKKCSPFKDLLPPKLVISNFLHVWGVFLMLLKNFLLDTRFNLYIYKGRVI